MKACCLILFLGLIAASCSEVPAAKNKGHFPSAISFKNHNGMYALAVALPSRTNIYDSVLRIGWDEASVLIYSVNDGRKCWDYFHRGATIKSWGCYSDKEFMVRKKELGLENYVTLDADTAWRKYQDLKSSTN